MDPLSTTASIVAVMQLFSEAVKYINGVAGATEDRKRLRDELRQCDSVLQQLKDYADDADEGTMWQGKISALSKPDGPLRRVHIALSAIIVKLKPEEGAKKAIAALKWPFKEKEIEKLIATIEREKALLVVALTNDCRTLILEMGKSLNENKRQLILMMDSLGRFEGSQNALKDSVDQLVNRHDNQEYEERNTAILNWLTLVDYASQQTDFILRRQPGTGQWLLDSLVFQGWMKSRKSLFCPGIPGAGKTILTSVVIDELRTRFKEDKSVGIAFVYCNFNRQDKQKAGDLLASLLQQLTRGQPSIPDAVKHLYDSYKDRRELLPIDKISDALLSVATLYSRVFIILDALDECQDIYRIEFLSKIFKLQENCQMSFFATSRHIPEIAVKFQGSARLEIRASDQDIRSFLDGNILQFPKRTHGNPELQDEIKAEIIKVANGMFLLAKLHLESLKGKRTLTALHDALNNLPSGSEVYSKVYEEVMKRIESQHEDDVVLAKRILAWITYARRPLSTGELQHALAVRRGDTQFDKNNIYEIEDMVSVCAGLVTVDEEGGIIRLVHRTTQEYFKQTQQKWFPNIERDITTTCVLYLSFDQFERGFCQNDEEFKERLQLNWFYDYASHNWGHHARGVSPLIPEVISFLEKNAQVEASSQALLAVQPFLSNRKKSQRCPRKITGLHLAASFGIAEAVQLLLASNSPSLKDSFGRTPLSWAAKNGHEAVVKLLLANDNVDPDFKERYGYTPLLRAASKGHEAVVKLLLNKDGVDINSRDGIGFTPLLFAAFNGYEAVVKLLLNKDGVDINSRDGIGFTPLLFAAFYGHEAVVKQLLNKDAVDINSRDVFNNTPLQWAVRNGYEAAVKLLLNKDGVDINSRGDLNNTPLLWAVCNGHEAVVKLLLSKKGVNLNCRGKAGLTPISMAAIHKKRALVHLLLAKNGADSSSEDVRLYLMDHAADDINSD